MEIRTNELKPSPAGTTYRGGVLSPHDSLQVYNGLDCCITLECWDAMQAYRDERCEGAYAFTRAMQAPALEMMLRGILVDEAYRWEAIASLAKRRDAVQEVLNELAQSVWGKALNPRSPAQLKEFFYKVMGLPEQFKSTKGVKSVSTDREALEKLQAYFYAEPFVNCILRIRELSKKHSVLLSEVDDDHRLRTSYNVAGTETWRWSSSANAWGGGTNLQNITEELRRVFISDPGWKLAYIDLEQAESRAVGWICFILFGAHAYLDACEGADLHTEVCKLVWPGLGWSSNDYTANRELADRKFYRDFSYRDMGKRGGHGTNYVGSAWTMARHLKVPVRLIEDFQYEYFRAFPEIKRWHTEVARQLQLHQALTTPLGMTRTFFGRPRDDATLREAVAFVPQSMVGQLLNLALWRIWYYLGKRVRILGQVHDAVLLEYREEEESEILPACLKLMETDLHHAGRRMTIPAEASVGWNWAKRPKDEDVEKGKAKPNPDGLRKYHAAGDNRVRQDSPETSRLDRVIP